MVNYAYAFSQSETEKYFKWIIININKWFRMFNCLICLAKQERLFKSCFWRKFHMPHILKLKYKSLKMRIWKLYFIALKNENKLNHCATERIWSQLYSRSKFTLVKFYSPFFSGNGEDHEYKFEPKMKKILNKQIK